MPCSCTVVTQSGVSGISYNLDLTSYVMQLYINGDTQCQNPVEGLEPSTAFLCQKSPTPDDLFSTRDAVSWECTPLPSHCKARCEWLSGHVYRWHALPKLLLLLSAEL